MVILPQLLRDRQGQTTKGSQGLVQVVPLVKRRLQAATGGGRKLILLSKLLCVCVKVTQSCPTLWDPQGLSSHGTLQARRLKWVAFPFSRGSSQPRDRTQVSCIAGGFFTSWATREALPNLQSPTITKHCQFYLLLKTSSSIRAKESPSDVCTCVYKHTYLCVHLCIYIYMCVYM